MIILYKIWLSTENRSHYNYYYLLYNIINIVSKQPCYLKTEIIGNKIKLQNIRLSTCG